MIEHLLAVLIGQMNTVRKALLLLPNEVYHDIWLDRSSVYALWLKHDHLHALILLSIGRHPYTHFAP
jgi:hypothetical protein